MSGIDCQIIERLSIVDSVLVAIEVYGPQFESIKDLLLKLDSETADLKLKANGLICEEESVAEQCLKEAFGSDEKTLALIKPEAFDKRAEIIDSIGTRGLTIECLKEKTLSKEECCQIYAQNKDKPYFDELVESLQTGPSLIMVLKGKGAVMRWRKMMGPVDPELAMSERPNCLRAKAGRNILQNGLHGSSSVMGEEFEKLLV